MDAWSLLMCVCARARAAMETAMAEGVPVGGYFCWSLLDNFEVRGCAVMRCSADLNGSCLGSLFAKLVCCALSCPSQWRDGYHFCFGLHYVDYLNNTNRVPKASSKWYGQLAQTGVIPPPLSH